MPEIFFFDTCQISASEWEKCKRSSVKVSIKPILGTPVVRGHALEFQMWTSKQNSNVTSCQIRCAFWVQWKQRIFSAYTTSKIIFLLVMLLVTVTLPQRRFKSLHCMSLNASTLLIDLQRNVLNSDKINRLVGDNKPGKSNKCQKGWWPATLIPAVTGRMKCKILDKSSTAGLMCSL